MQSAVLPGSTRDWDHVEWLASEVMVGADLLGMLRRARREDDQREVHAALGRLVARVEPPAPPRAFERDLEERLAAALRTLVRALERCAASPGIVGLDVSVAVRGAHQVARSVQSLRDFDRMESVTASGDVLRSLLEDSEELAAPLTLVLSACEAVQFLARSIAERSILHDWSSRIAHLLGTPRSPRLAF
jgi:hypothetical protein